MIEPGQMVWGNDILDAPQVTLNAWIIDYYHAIEWRMVDPKTGEVKTGQGLTNTEFTFIIHLHRARLDADNPPSLRSTLAKRMGYKPGSKGRGLRMIVSGLKAKGLLEIKTAEPGKPVTYDFSEFTRRILAARVADLEAIEAAKGRKKDSYPVPLGEEEKFLPLTKGRKKDSYPVPLGEEEKFLPLAKGRKISSPLVGRKVPTLSPPTTTIKDIIFTDLFEIYKNINNDPTNHEIDSLRSTLDTLQTPDHETPYQWLRYAIEEAINYNRKTLKYVLNIIDSIERSGSLTAHILDGPHKNTTLPPTTPESLDQHFDNIETVLQSTLSKPGGLDIWQEVLATLENSMSSSQYANTFKDSKLVTIDGNLATVQTSTAQAHTWIVNRLQAKADKAIKAASDGAITGIRFVMPGEHDVNGA